MSLPPKMISRRFGSLPVRGAWVEIRTMKSARFPSVGRSPCGERGLKSFLYHTMGSVETSLPVRGAWVEMPSFGVKILPCLPSLPVRGAWVEITTPRSMVSGRQVAPRAGSVG